MYIACLGKQICVCVCVCLFVRLLDDWVFSCNNSPAACKLNENFVQLYLCCVVDVVILFFSTKVVDIFYFVVLSFLGLTLFFFRQCFLLLHFAVGCKCESLCMRILVAYFIYINFLEFFFV